MTMWALIAWGLIPPGFVVVLLLSSGLGWAMKLGSKLLSCPIHIGFFQVSLASLCTASALVLAILSYSGMKRYEALDRVDAKTIEHQDRFRMHYFMDGRNFWMSLLGLTLWAVAWRLKSLHRGGQLRVHEPRGPPRSIVVRVLYLVVGCVCLVCADIPICRMEYNLALMTHVTPVKERMIATTGGQCENVMEASAGTSGICAMFCRETRALSEARLDTVLWARQWHPMGKLAAEVFDSARKVEQDSARINELFAKKTCAKVLSSVDKSNMMVNGITIASALVAVVGSLSCFASAAQKRDEEKVHTS